MDAGGAGVETDVVMEPEQSKALPGLKK